MAAHWGVILQEGKDYECFYTEREATIITDYKSYYDKIGIISRSIEWIRKGYTEENMHEVMPGYMSHREVTKRYTKRVSMPYLKVISDDEVHKYELFYTMTNGEIMEKFDLDEKCISTRRNKGGPSFDTTQTSIDEYFDYTPIRRDNKLNELWKNNTGQEK